MSELGRPLTGREFELMAAYARLGRQQEVADEFGIDYNKLSYWVKSGKVPCLRASEGGKPRFLPEHIKQIQTFQQIVKGLGAETPNHL